VESCWSTSPWRCSQYRQITFTKSLAFWITIFSAIHTTLLQRWRGGGVFKFLVPCRIWSTPHPLLSHFPQTRWTVPTVATATSTEKLTFPLPAPCSYVPTYFRSWRHIVPYSVSPIPVNRCSHNCHTPSNLNVTYCPTHSLTCPHMFSMALRWGWYGGNRKQHVRVHLNRYQRHISYALVYKVLRGLKFRLWQVTGEWYFVLQHPVFHMLLSGCRYRTPLSKHIVTSGVIYHKNTVLWQIEK
jgi:hypothetical protein